MEKSRVVKLLHDVERLRWLTQQRQAELDSCCPSRRDKVLASLQKAEKKLSMVDSAMELLTPEERLVVYHIGIARQKGAARSLCQMLQREKSTVYRIWDRAVRKMGKVM